MHVAEQIGENEACLREYGCTPVELLSNNHILSHKFTAVHSIHVRPDEVEEACPVPLHDLFLSYD